MPEPTDENSTSLDEFLQSLGSALNGVAVALQNSPDPRAKGLAPLIDKMGDAIGAEGAAVEVGLGDLSPAEAIGNILGGIAGSATGAFIAEAGITAALTEAATYTGSYWLRLAVMDALAPLFLTNPFLAAAAAVIIFGGMMYAFGLGGSLLGENLGGALDDVADLLSNILADPLVLDLDGDGVELVPIANSLTMFDLDDDGVAERTGWVSPHDGLLVQDANGNGIVDGVGELFGSSNVDGYDELRTLDANRDGRIDSADPAFAELRIWRDLDSNGISTEGELQTLAESGIASFNLGYTQIDLNIGGSVMALPSSTRTAASR